MYFLVLVSFCFALGSAAKIEGVVCPNHPVSSYTVHFPSPTNQIFYTARNTLLHLSDEHKVSYSTDIGRSWDLVSGIANKTIRRIYVSPDRSHVIYMGFGNDDMWLSDNGGSVISAQAHSPGHLTNLKYHPKDPQWVLGITRPGCRGEATCSQDLYFSPNNGLDWGRIRTYVENAFWHEGSAAVKQNLVVQERFNKEGNMYRQRGRIDLVKSDTFFRDDAVSLATDIAASLAIHNHIFIAKWEPEGGFQLWASLDMGDHFNRVRFSESLKENSYTILDLSEGSAFIGVSHGVNFGHVYAGDSMDRDFVLSLKNNIRSRPGARPTGTDFRAFRGIEGVYIANVWKRVNEDTGQGNSGSEAQTLISYDKGGEWKALPAPDKSKRLNLLGPAEEWGGFYSRSQAIGIMFASGMVGDVLSTNPSDHGLFVTRDAGWTWTLANNGSHAYEIGNKGAMVIAAKDEEFTNTYQYSLNEGQTWNDCNLFNYKAGVQTPRMDIDNIISDPTLSSKYFVLFGDAEDGTGYVSVIDFGGVHERECNELDYEFWEPSDRDGDECLLGRRTIYKRRRADSMCYLPDNFESVGNVVKNCPCDYENYMCEFCYVREGERCVFDDANPLCAPFHPLNLTKNCPVGAHMIISQGYRRVAGDSCNVSLPGSLNLLPRNVTCGEAATSSSSAGVIALVFVAILLIVIGVSWYLAGTNETFRNALAQVIPEKFLPDRSRDVPSAEYSQLGSTQAFDAEAGDEEDARELKIGSESSSESSS